MTWSASLRCLYHQARQAEPREGREETQGLLQAMESGVEKAWLGFKNVKQEYEVTLDIKALTEYSGQGVCSIKTQCRPEDLGQEQKLES